MIDKGLTEEIILEGAGQAFEGGWNKVKLYFMLGLPTETEKNMKAIAIWQKRLPEDIMKFERTAQWKMSDHGQFFVLHSETVHPVPVGTDVSK